MNSKVSPENIVLMVNSVVGSIADWRFTDGQFVKKLFDKEIMHCNFSNLAFDDADMRGVRLAKEVLGAVKRRPKIKKDLFCGSFFR